MTIIRQDTFTRSNVASGWGTATDSNVWTIQSGNGQSVASNEGVISSSSASTFATLGAATSSADGEGLVRFQVKDVLHNTAGIILRWTDASNHWLARYNGAASPSPGINVMVKVSGTYTSQSTIAKSLSSSNFYWLRFRAQGTTISIKLWQDGTSEPGAWDGQYTLSSQNVAGKVGLYGFANSTNVTNYDTFSVDDLTTNNVSGTATATGQGTGVATPTSRVPGTGIGTISRTTGTQTWNFSGNGYGVGDVTGTEYDFAYTDSTGSGWAVGAIPAYGGMPIAAWYQIDSSLGLNTTLPQKTSANGNLMTLLTTQAGGIVHWEEEVGSTFAASENPTFSGTNHFVEQAPTGTNFRAYYKCIADANDANGITWNSYFCMYPGDPGFVVFRLDQINNSGATISPTESDMELIASLLGDGGTSPTGVWNRSNGFYGTIGGSTTTGWPAAGVHQNGTFDFAGNIPDSTQRTIVLGAGAAVTQDPSVQFSWASGGFMCNDSDPNGTKPTRIKFGFYSNTGTTWNIPNGTTNSYYVLRVFKRDLTSADMALISADWKSPGTPTATVGSYTAWRIDERAYEFAASANNLSATLSMTGTGVSVRYKPIIKVTNWTDTGTPVIQWGGALLGQGVDYNYYNDTTNHILYVQLYFDIVSGTASPGQKTNSTLTIAPFIIPDTGTGTDGILGDLGVGTDTASVAVVLPLTDAGTGSESLASTTTFPQTDTGTGSEAPANTILFTVTDSGTGTDSEATSSQFVIPDSGAGTDSALLLTSPSVADSGSGAETGPTISATLPLTDTATGAEAESSSTTFTLADAGTGTDSALLLTSPNVADAGTGTDTPTIFAQASVADAGTGSETPTLLIQPNLIDTGAGSEAINTAIQPSISDTGTGSETPAILVQPSPTDAGIGNDAVSVQGGLIVLPDVGSGADAAVALAKIPLFDAGTGTDSLHVATTLASETIATTFEMAIPGETMVLEMPGVTPLVLMLMLGGSS